MTLFTLLHGSTVNIRLIMLHLYDICSIYFRVPSRLKPTVDSIFILRVSVSVWCVKRSWTHP